MAELTVFLTSYNTGLQGSKAHEQDLTSWLIPVLLSAGTQVQPDLYAIAVQELLPLHLALAGLSKPVLIALTQRIESVISAHATKHSPTGTAETFTLVARVCHVGTALWVFARDSTTRGRIRPAHQSSVGMWHAGMGNKAAVGVRVPIMRGKGDNWETLTFVSTHLDAHDHNIPRRNAQYEMILSSLIFTGDDVTGRAQPHQSSHLFIMGDLNYRLSRLPQRGDKPFYPRENNEGNNLADIEQERALMLPLDTLQQQQRAGNAFGGLREGDLTRFAPTYKRIVGEVNGYSQKRIPGWTDRILFASYNDPVVPGSPESSYKTKILHFNSTPELVISDHKPVHAVVYLPPPNHGAATPANAPVLPPPPKGSRPRPGPASPAELRKAAFFGNVLDRIVGFAWTIIVLLGFGNEKAGMGVGAFIAMLWGIWSSGLLAGFGID